MKIVLRSHNEQFTIVRAYEARGEKAVREFTSEHLALSFLHRFVGEDVYMQSLRGELESTRETTDVMRMSDREILRAFAGLLAVGRLKVVVSDVPRATISIGLGASQGKAAPGEAPPLEHKPAPIVPQEYPILARVESDEVMGSTRKLIADLQALVHMLFNRNPPPSQVAAEYTSTAESTGLGSKRAIEELDMLIEARLFRDASLARPPSTIAIEYATLGQTEGKQAAGVVQSFAAGLKPLLWEERDLEAPPSILAAEYASLGQTEGEQAKSAITGFSAGLSPLLFKEKEREEKPSTIASEYASLSQSEGEQAKAAVQGFAAGLSSLLYSSTELSNLRSGSGSGSEPEGT